MRGKLVVGILLGGTLAMFVFSLWFFGTTSPADQRFKLDRTAIPTDIATLSTDNLDKAKSELLPDLVSDFLRGTTQDFVLQGDKPLHAEAVYANSDGTIINLTIDSLSQGESAAQALQNSFLAVKADRVVFHEGATFPFGYWQASDSNPQTAVFSWVNGGWIFRASAPDGNSDALLRFVNAYLF